MDAATLSSGLFTSTTTTTTSSSTSTSTSTTDAADDDVTPRWNDGSVFKRVHAIQQFPRSKRRSSGSSQPPRPKQRPHGKSDSRFFTNATKSDGVSDEVFDQRAERTVSISMATGRDATVSDVPGGGWYEWGTTSN